MLDKILKNFVVKSLTLQKSVVSTVILSSKHMRLYLIFYQSQTTLWYALSFILPKITPQQKKNILLSRLLHHICKKLIKILHQTLKIIKSIQKKQRILFLSLQPQDRMLHITIDKVAKILICKR
eukprot:TRINITY_DN936_c0_g1_i3.p2 TRINITY_DN936_c0_g1~~TRINITY_DN936_c0_g1_i3.p2  ORF type:complete len:134 (-),score=1.29 TRINITY_DN936_c0_g1_i3:880-1251(-)